MLNRLKCFLVVTGRPSPHTFPLRAQVPTVIRQAINMVKDLLKDFSVSEKGHGSYRLLGLLRWVMVLIFISFGIQKFTPQSADGIALYISNSPFVWWLSIFGIGAWLIDGNWYVCNYVVVFLLDTRCRQMERIHRPNSVEPHRGILVQRCRSSLRLYRVVFGIAAKESRPASVELMSRTRRVGGKYRDPRSLNPSARHSEAAAKRPSKGDGNMLAQAPSISLSMR
jgi:hypothetical protein